MYQVKYVHLLIKSPFQLYRVSQKLEYRLQVLQECILIMCCTKY